MNRKYKVMVVDDQMFIRMMLKKVLISSGYCALDASDGIEAIKIVQKEKPDIALVDVNIPGLSGISLLKHLREVDSKLATIFMSGSINDKFLKEAEKSGAIGFLQKPFDIFELVAKLDELVVSRFSSEKVVKKWRINS